MTARNRIRSLLGKACSTAVLVALVSVQAGLANAGPREQAKRIHDRIAGVPPSESVLDDMAADITSGNALNAAFTAMNDSAFYDVTLKNFSAPWTNEAMSKFVPLNDYIATVIGLVRDEDDFRKVLYDDILYVGDPTLSLPSYSTSNNNHYESLETSGASLKDNLVARSQSNLNGLPPAATAGVITSRASAKAFFSAGTNRAMFRFTLINHMCNDLEQVADVTLPTDRIRQDVSRSPGGDSRVFLNNCVGCHTGMDPMAQAFAYYDYEYDQNTDPDGDLGRLVYNAVGQTDPETGSRVQAKYHINSATFEQGYVTPDDSWDNYWRQGSNRRLGWDPSLPGSGSGAKSLGMEFAHSDAFTECQVTKVFENVCLRPPSDSEDRSQISSMVASFAGQGYKLKQVFAESAVYCMGE
ncbi:hypothetical protein [Marinobacter sp. F3R08]|uniref:hypothetical protein n=1 Tax=Marinobacter sp. F3R08 TaxID=2841559 RepID=UPI001C09678B|nr:hypothetical protein [Marinobacter sp. F3R08]MBU2955414.1 hypothetical protein [Marinobacter sp. F3R08]